MKQKPAGEGGIPGEHLSAYTEKPLWPPMDCFKQ